MSSVSDRSTLPWILRIGVAGCFIGHGAFGIITKAAWVPYFAVGGISETWAWKLMPWIGTMDVLIGVLAIAWPCRALFAWASIWAIWTALCRPLAGEPFWETLERAGNYGVPLAILVVVGLRGEWLKRLPARWPELADDAVRARLAQTLRFTTCTLLVGHAGLGLFVQKAGLTHHYTSLWAAAPASTVVWVGALEFALAAALLVRPLPALLIGISIWKLATESLFLIAGAPVWEVIERFGSYTAPLALALLLAKSRNDNLPRLSTAAA
jgi:hypothetical protein